MNPYKTISDAKKAGFPTKAEGIAMTISQINKLASIYDALKKEGEVDNPMAVAWVAWKKIFKKEKNKWIKKEKQKGSELPISFPIRFAEKGIPSKIHLIPLGEWEHSEYGKIKITNREIEQFVVNFKAKVRRDIPITEGHEVMDEKPAIGWLKKLTAEKDGLWSKVEWTEEGKELLAKKKYKYFSPEYYRTYEDPETQEVYTNVLVGGALTNKPYFKELKQIVFSENLIINQFNNMNLQDILKKEAGSLTNEEKKFLQSHMSELNSEQLRKFAEEIAPESDENDDGDKNKESDDNDGDNKEDEKEEEKESDDNEDNDEKVEGSETVKVKASEYKALQEKADKGAQAFAELRKSNITNEVNKIIFNEQNREGKFMPKTKDAVVGFMLSLKTEQLSAFREILKALPKVEMFGEIGDMGNDNILSGIDKELEMKVSKLQENDSALSYSDATRQIFDNDISFSERYNEAHA